MYRIYIYLYNQTYTRVDHPYTMWSDINIIFTVILLYFIICYLLLFRRSPLIPSRNLDEVFTNNYMALMSLRSRSRIKASVVLTRADHLFIHTII